MGIFYKAEADGRRLRAYGCKLKAVSCKLKAESCELKGLSCWRKSDSCEKSSGSFLNVPEKRGGGTVHIVKKYNPVCVYSAKSILCTTCRYKAVCTIVTETSTTLYKHLLTNNIAYFEGRC